jgi:uncharacterized MnhB-related membrane protein
MEIIKEILQALGQWILITFAIYYVIYLLIKSNVIGCMILSGILSMGIVLAFLI